MKKVGTADSGYADAIFKKMFTQAAVDVITYDVSTQGGAS